MSSLLLLDDLRMSSLLVFEDLRMLSLLLFEDLVMSLDEAMDPWSEDGW